MASPLINGQAYSFSLITVNILGTPVVGITAISYKTSQEKVNNYGAGNRPVSRGYGKKECEGSITIDMEELEALIAAAPNRDILDIPPFDIIVTYTPQSGAVVVHTLKNCEFLEDPIEAGDGDTRISVEVPLIISHIVK